MPVLVCVFQCVSVVCECESATKRFVPMRKYNASAGVLVLVLYMCASRGLQWKGIKQGVLDDGCKW